MYSRMLTDSGILFIEGGTIGGAGQYPADP